VCPVTLARHVLMAYAAVSSAVLTANLNTINTNTLDWAGFLKIIL